jgi:hypothetical protein
MNQVDGTNHEESRSNDPDVTTPTRRSTRKRVATNKLSIASAEEISSPSKGRKSSKEQANTVVSTNGSDDDATGTKKARKLGKKEIIPTTKASTRKTKSKVISTESVKDAPKISSTASEDDDDDVIFKKIPKTRVTKKSTTKKDKSNEATAAAAAATESTTDGTTVVVSDSNGSTPLRTPKSPKPPTHQVITIRDEIPKLWNPEVASKSNGGSYSKFWSMPHVIFLNYQTEYLWVSHCGRFD